MKQFCVNEKVSIDSLNLVLNPKIGSGCFEVIPWIGQCVNFVTFTWGFHSKTCLALQKLP